MTATTLIDQIFTQTYASFIGTERQQEGPHSQQRLFSKAETTKFLEEYIIQVIKAENDLTLDDKVAFLRYVITNSCYLTNLNDFYEEECHLSILNWIWKERGSLKATTNSPFALNVINAKLLELLLNSLIIFEILPIRPQDLIGLSLFEKINKIKGYVSQTHPALSDRIQNLLNYWKKQYECITEQAFLGRKHVRPVDSTETDAESEENGVVWKKRKLAPEKMKRAVLVDLNLNKVLIFNTEDEPSEIGKEKNRYDPLMLI